MFIFVSYLSFISWTAALAAFKAPRLSIIRAKKLNLEQSCHRRQQTWGSSQLLWPNQ